MNTDRREFLKAVGVLAVSTTLGGLSTPAAAASAGNRAARSAGASVPGRKIVLNGVRYHIGEQGSGNKVVLLLHGMPDTSGVWFQQVQALVQSGYRVIAPDMLGYGETEKPEDAQRYRGEAILADMLALLDTLNVSKVDLVGHDWGAFVSWELALNFSARFRRHVALSVGHPDMMMNVSSIADVKYSWYMYLNAQDDAAQLYAANDGDFLKKFIIPTHPDIEEVWSRMKDPRSMQGMLNWDRANPMASAYLAAATSDAAPRQCQVPTLGLWSSGDTYLWEGQMSDSAKLMSAPWRYVRIDDASHWLMLDRPQQVNTQLLEWLQVS